MISRSSLVALQHRKFRLIWLGLLVSFTGSMMQNAALLWHVSLLVAPERKGLALATVVFGVSRSSWVTFFCLAMTGATDTVSMIVRNIVRQLETPDRLRGRMTGINMVFFMGGPQLGELEAGAVANWLGASVSVVSGGVGCLLATLWVAIATPALRHYRRTPPTSAA